MFILTLRTDKPEAEIGLFQDNRQLAYHTWQAHRQLAETVHVKIKQLLQEQVVDWGDLGGLVLYRGPGSFTGLRIGASVINALASGLKIPVVGGQTHDWYQLGIKQLLAGQNDQLVMPEYGAPANITAPRK